MPKLGLTATEGTILRWLKAEGEAVKKSEPLVEVITEKVNFVVESPASGVLLKVLARENQIVPIATPIGVIGEAGEVFEGLNQIAEPAKNDEAPPAESEATVGPAEPGRGQGDGGRVIASPAARRRASELGVDLSLLQGTGPGGRIVVEDVEKAAQAAECVRSPKVTPLAKKIASEHGVLLEGIGGTGQGGKITRDDVLQHLAETKAPPQPEYKPVPLSGMRKTIADRMSASARTTAAVTITTEVDMEKVVALRRELLPVLQEKAGVRLTYNDILIKAVAISLARHPGMNASLAEDGIRQHCNINIGMAVALPTGLIVPVIKNADRKSIPEIALEAKDLAARARESKLGMDDLTGGTFTVSNLGAYGIDVFTPIINLPEAAILGVGRIREKAVPLEGNIVIRPLMHLSLVFDHRIVDGAQAAMFLQEICKFLEHPYSILF